MRLHDVYTLQVSGPPAAGLLPFLRELYGLCGPEVSRGVLFRDLDHRLHGVAGGQDFFYTAVYERQIVAAVDVSACRSNFKVGLVHRLYTAPPFRRRGLAAEHLAQAVMDFSILGGELLLLTVPRASRAYRYLRNVRFQSYPDTTFEEAPDPDGELLEPKPESAPVSTPSEPSSSSDPDKLSEDTGSTAAKAKLSESSGELTPSDNPDAAAAAGWGQYDTGSRTDPSPMSADDDNPDVYSDPSYYGGYDYGYQQVKPPLPDPTRSDGVAWFAAVFGRRGLADFGDSYFNPKLETRTRPARRADWAALMLLANWPQRRKLLHWHLPHLRSQPADRELIELLERCECGLAAAVVLETSEKAVVGLATACRPPSVGEARPLPPGRPHAKSVRAGPLVAELIVHPAFRDRAGGLLEELAKRCSLAGAAALVEPDSPLEPHWATAGFAPREPGPDTASLNFAGANFAESAAMVPGLRLWVRSA